MQPNTCAKYLGLRLNSPIIVGACKLTLNPESVRELAIAGAGAVVLPSLFEEQVIHQFLEKQDSTQTNSLQTEAQGSDGFENFYNGGTEGYLQAISNLKRTTGIPIIANLNGSTDGQWLKIANAIEQAGADALEVMLEPMVTDPATSADQVEDRLLNAIGDLCDEVSLPVSVKLSSFHTNLPNLAWRLTERGAAGLVCFAHEPTWNVHTDRIEASMGWSLTAAGIINPTIAGLIRVRAGGPEISVGASGGICSPEDVIRALIAGADVAMVTSEIYRGGPDVVAHLVEGLSSYLDRHRLESIEFLVKSRPKLQPRRETFLKCITQPGANVDPTPHVSFLKGDRWGHVQ